MAHGRPWYKRNGADFVLATLSMPDAETKWAYSCMVDMLNDRDRPLADDPGFICGFTGLSKRKWAVVRDYLIAHGYLVETGDGHLTNPRFERERAERADAHQRSVDGGRDGGHKSAAKRAAAQGDLPLGDQPKAGLSAEKGAQELPINDPKPKDKSGLNGGGPPKNKDLGQPPPQATRARQRREEREEESQSSTSSLVSAQALDALELTDHLTRIAGVRNVEPARIMGNVEIVREWLDLGVDVVEIAHQITAARDQSRKPLHSLKYFDPAIRQAHARKEYPHERDRHDPSEIADPLLRRYLEAGGTLDR